MSNMKKKNNEAHGTCGCHICRKWIIQYVRHDDNQIVMLTIMIGQ